MTQGKPSVNWDFENRVVQAVVPGTNGGTTTFKYDPFGRRIQKSGPLGTTNYLYDGPNLVEETDGNANILARYTQGKMIDQPLAENEASTTNYYQQDALNSITSLSNISAALSNTYTYDSYGMLAASTGTFANPFQYTGREFDQETGVYYYRARYYDPTMGRFTSEDPFRFTGGIDFYQYASNSPILLNDPMGLEPQGCTDCKGKPIQGLQAGKACCSNETPAPPTPGATPYPPNYFYLGVRANYMYQYGGTNAWGNAVRTCLMCMYRHGVDADSAHRFCYHNGSTRTTAWQTGWGYTVAFYEGGTYLLWIP